MANLLTEVKAHGGWGWMVYCPGCKYSHVFDARWKFNGNMESPTFSPSLKVTWDYTDNAHPQKVCHSFVRNGEWQFLTDCTHDLAGQTLPMIEDPD